jgi:beta-barrel assembly-enhancing protease
LSDSASKAKGLLWVLGALVLAGVAAVSLPVLVRHVPWPVEEWLGGAIGLVPPGQVCDAHPESLAALDALVARIYPISKDDIAPVSVRLIRGETVNAFATLGGRVYVFQGLLEQARTPEELAGVLSHEIEHVRNRHILQGFVVGLATFQALRIAIPPGGGDQVARELLSLQFSRDQEGEADEKGLERLRAAQVDARGFEDFFERAAKLPSAPAIVSSHPSSDVRRELAQRFRDYPTRPVLDAREWRALSGICR